MPENAAKQTHPPNNSDINVYLHDKYAVKYSTKQLEIALSRCTYAGLVSTLTAALIFLQTSIVIDYLGFQWSLLSHATYEIRSAYDLGVVSGPRDGYFGWTILLVALSLLSLAFAECFFSRKTWVVRTACLIVFVSQLSLILVSTYEKFFKEETRQEVKLMQNHYVVMAVSLSVLVVEILWFIKLSMIVKRMEDRGEFPQEETLISGKVKR